MTDPVNQPGKVRETLRKEVDVIGGEIVEQEGYDQVINNVGE